MEVRYPIDTSSRRSTFTMAWKTIEDPSIRSTTIPFLEKWVELWKLFVYKMYIHLDYGNKGEFLSRCTIILDFPSAVSKQLPSSSGRVCLVEGYCHYASINIRLIYCEITHTKKVWINIGYDKPLWSQVLCLKTWLLRDIYVFII